MKTKLDYSVSTVPNAGKELGAMISKLLQFKSENPPVEDYDVQLFIKEELEKVGLKAKLHHPGFVRKPQTFQQACALSVVES